MSDSALAEHTHAGENVATTVAARMEELARLTDALKAVVPRGASVGYVDYPMHMNVGDLLIFMGTMEFFRTNRNRIAGAFCLFDDSPRALNGLAGCDVIVCHGGGNFGDIYPRHQALRERVVRHFPDKPIVVMPQSFHFGSESSMRRSGEVFRSHRDLTLCVRDLPSQELARVHFSDRVLLVPDMAHRLYAHFAPARRRAAVAPEPLLLLRRDVEADVRTAPAPETGRDWRDLLRPLDKLRIGRHRATSMLAGRLEIPATGIVFAHNRTVESVMDDLAARLARHRHWITSRLHGAIFGLLLDRTVELLDNSYGKNSRYFAHWGDGIPTLSLTSRGGRTP